MRTSRHPSWMLALVLSMQMGCASLDRFRPSPETEEPPAPSLQADIPENQVADLCEAAGKELELRGHHAEAVAQYERSRKLNPSKNHLEVRLAKLYDELDDPDRAQREFRRAVERDPNNADLLNDAGYFFYRCGDFAQSEEYLRSALEQNPEHRRAALNLALVRGDQEEFEDCLRLFQKHLTEEKALCNLGVVLVKKGKRAEARIAFEKALQANANYRPARSFLDYLGDQDEVTLESHDQR